jgi:c-di-GMP-binding flagellar brake protein YcgR
MFGRTKTLWQRLVGSAPETGSESSVAVAEERRVWVRHPADVNTTCQTAEAGPGERLPALVRNISQGGISLLLGRSFEAGEMLSIELPGAAEGTIYTVLACVVHVRPKNDDEWAVGCTFSRELSDDDLQAFGARRVKHEAGDQRQWVRFATNVTASYQIITAADLRKLPTEVLNISATGIGLVVTQPIPIGSLLSLELHGANGAAERTMLACVVHVTGRAEGEWALGCNFIRSLSENDLRELQ